MELIDFRDLNNYNKLTWSQIRAIQTLQRNMFPNELFWTSSDTCSGFVVSANPDCQLRTDEMKLIMYSPEECAAGVIKNCDKLLTYARVQISAQSKESAMLQFFTTIFTCIILTTFALLF